MSDNLNPALPTLAAIDAAVPNLPTDDVRYVPGMVRRDDANAVLKGLRDSILVYRDPVTGVLMAKGDGSDPAEVVIRSDPIAWRPEAIIRGLPSSGAVNIGVASSNVTGTRSIIAQTPAVRPFTGVWLRFLHYNTAAGLTLHAARATSTPQHLAPSNDNAGLVWSSAAAATVGGAALPYTSAPAVAGVSNTIPAVFQTDRIAVASVNRTDSATHGAQPLLRTVVRVNDSSVLPSLGGTNLAAVNAAGFNPGFKYGNFMYSSGTDGVGTLGGLTPGEFGGAFLPVEVVFDYATPVKTLCCFGDSNFQGVGTVGTWSGWPVRLMYLSVNDDVPVSVSNYGNAGQRHADSIATALAYIPSIAGASRAAVCIQGWSPNEGAASDAVFASCRDRVLRVIAAANKYSLPVIVCTTPSVTGYPAGDTARVVAHNVWVRGLAAYGARVLDVQSLIAPAGVLTAEYDVDGTHFNDAGHLVIATAARSVV